MSIHDRDPYPDTHQPEGIPTMTLAAPTTAAPRGTSEGPADTATSRPNRSSAVDETPEAAGAKHHGSDEDHVPTDADQQDDGDLTAAPDQAPVAGTQTGEPVPGAAGPARWIAQPSSETPLFGGDDLAELRARWDHVQASFVDDPRDCVRKADGLVADVVNQVTRSFTEARTRLEDRWGRGEEASTEDLRVALKRYREFFERLLAV